MRSYCQYFLMALLTVVLAGCASSGNMAAGSSSGREDGSTSKYGNRGRGEKNCTMKEFSPMPFHQRMVAEKQHFAFGKEPSCGLWMISRHSVPLKNGRTVREASALAEVRAKKQIAAFMGTKITAHDKSYMSSKTNAKGEEEVTETFESYYRQDIEQFLRGVTPFYREVKKGRLLASFYVTAQSIDATAELEKQLRAAPPGTVRAVGFGVIENGRTAPARREAVQGALRNAVEQVMGTTVIGTSQLMDNDKVKAKMLSQTAGNVKQYRVVKEEKVDDNYQVIVNAQVDPQDLLDNYASLVRSMGNPEFYVKASDPDLSYSLNGFLADLGFAVTRDSEKAYFVLDTECRYLKTQNDHYGEGIQIDLGIVLLDVKSGQRLFSMRNVPRKTSTYSGSYHQIRQAAANKAFKSMKKQIHGKLNGVVMDWVLNGHPVDVVFQGFSGNREMVAQIEKSIGRVPCAKVETHLQDGSRLVFKCSYIGPTADFEEMLIDRLSRDLPEGSALPKTESISLTRMVLTF